ncbi:hypothetical protein [uncultured Paraglaciecola sp.]|uniref:hypothetical protein n=1 Tax=uncultured Paraglaciecola sp. TaxID=1765024 RepID=UPI0026192718|nr:hypothetical protein [uncultured Paraglaciecola sp.]
MEKVAFIEYCAQQLNRVFVATKKGQPNDKLKHQTEGLLRAAELLDIINRTQALKLLEDEHVKVFGVTPEQRAEKKQFLEKVKEASSLDFFEIPAIQRR